MTDRTGKEHTMKRIGTLIGIAAALAVPATASAGNQPQVVAQVKPQVVKAAVVAQVHPQVVAQVVETQQHKTKRFTLRRISRR
jgi:hypothetical protein